MPTLSKRVQSPVRIEGKALLELLPKMKKYRKVLPIRAIQLPYAFTIEMPTTVNGVAGKVTAKAGTWLALNDVGIPYPIPEENFKRMYEEYNG